MRFDDNRSNTCESKNDEINEISDPIENDKSNVVLFFQGLKNYEDLILIWLGIFFPSSYLFFSFNSRVPHDLENRARAH